jgi:hypothetical protein
MTEAKVRDVLDWLANSAYATWVNESGGWPVALTIHAFGVAIVIGLMAIIGLRLMGLFRTIPYTALNALLPYVWVAVLFQFISGFTLWMSKPLQYLADGMFEVKFTLVMIACVATAYFHGTFRREAAAWEASGKASRRGIKLVVSSCALWAAVVIGGRLTAYLGSLYLH